MPRHPSCALSSLTTKKNNFLLSTLVCCNFYTLLNNSEKIVRGHSSRLSFLNFQSTSEHSLCFIKSWIFTLLSVSTTWYMVGVLGFEPRTSSLSGTRSNQLSYTPSRFISSRQREVVWWSWWGSNPRHPACKAGALANWATAPFQVLYRSPNSNLLLQPLRFHPRSRALKTE